jgi:hypothetical protein
MRRSRRDRCARRANGAAGGAPRVVVALNPRQVLRKQLVLPMAVEENLLRTLAYDLDRHTPFRPEQVYFDAAVIDRDPVKKTMRVDWVAALKTVVDSAAATPRLGARRIAVSRTSLGSPSRLNLLPPEARARRMRWRQWQVWLPTALVALAAVAVVVVPLVQKRGYAIVLLQQTEAARVQAEAADGVRREFERLQSDYNYALARKYMYPGTCHILDDITRVLPDDTWLSQLELKTTQKGKDTARRFCAEIGQWQQAHQPARGQQADGTAAAIAHDQFQPGPASVRSGARLRSPRRRLRSWAARPAPGRDRPSRSVLAGAAARPGAPGGGTADPVVPPGAGLPSAPPSPAPAPAPPAGTKP